jgi:transcriptional regulator GlxA family with amidase domain
MTYQSASLAFASPTARGAVPPAMLAALLDQAQRSLDHDLDAARDVIARLSALLAGTEIGEPDPANDRRRPAARGAGLAPWRTKRLEAFIEANLDRTITIESLAQLVRLSCGHLSRAFKDTFGASPHAHVMSLRIARAKGLMLATREPLSRIAFACGFADQAHFSRLFRQTEGSSPNSWRRAHWVEA